MGAFPKSWLDQFNTESLESLQSNLMAQASKLLEDTLPKPSAPNPSEPLLAPSMDPTSPLGSMSPAEDPMLGLGQDYLSQDYLASMAPEPEMAPQPAPQPETANAGTSGNTSVRTWRPLIQDAARRYGVPASVGAGIMDIESGGRTHDDQGRPLRSPVGAASLMQVMPFHFGPDEDPDDPRTNVDKGFKILADGYRKWGSWDKAAAHYFGAIDAQGNITGASDAVGQTGGGYVSAFNARRSSYADLDEASDGDLAMPALAARKPGAGLTPDQFSLANAADAYAACGPAAAVAFARATGRFPTLEEAVDLARKKALWDNGTGMYGPQSEVALLREMGVAASAGGVDWDRIKKDVQAGNPVIIDTPGHYFVVEDYDPQTGRFNFGKSAEILKAANHQTWFTPDQLSRFGMGEARSAIHLDNPATHGVSTANAESTSEPEGTESPDEYAARLMLLAGEPAYERKNPFSIADWSKPPAMDKEDAEAGAFSILDKAAEVFGGLGQAVQSNAEGIKRELERHEVPQAAEAYGQIGPEAQAAAAEQGVMRDMPLGNRLVKGLNYTAEQFPTILGRSKDLGGAIASSAEDVLAQAATTEEERQATGFPNPLAGKKLIGTDIELAPEGAKTTAKDALIHFAPVGPLQHLQNISLAGGLVQHPTETAAMLGGLHVAGRLAVGTAGMTAAGIKHFGGPFLAKLGQAADEIEQRFYPRQRLAAVGPGGESLGLADDGLQAMSTPGGSGLADDPIQAAIQHRAGNGVQDLQGLADGYMQDAGLGDAVPVTPRLQANPDFQRRVADAYDALPDDDLANPAVQKSYAALAKEVEQQYDYLIDQGYRFEPFDGPDPYDEIAKARGIKKSEAVMEDLRENKHLAVYAGDSEHPLLTPEQNWKFRAVHDVFGHAAEGNNFAAMGEENAWAAHSKMFSPEARPAMTTETRGQNSWVNFGPQMRDAQGNLLDKGMPGYLPPSQRSFARQKAALLPEEFYAHPGMQEIAQAVAPNTPTEAVSWLDASREEIVRQYQRGLSINKIAELFSEQGKKADVLTAVREVIESAGIRREPHIERSLRAGVKTQAEAGAKGISYESPVAGKLVLDSALEAAMAHKLDQDVAEGVGGIVSWRRGGANEAIPYSYGGKRSVFFPDFVVTHADGTTHLIDTKSDMIRAYQSNLSKEEVLGLNPRAPGQPVEVPPEKFLLPAEGERASATKVQISFVTERELGEEYLHGFADMLRQGGSEQLASNSQERLSRAAANLLSAMQKTGSGRMPFDMPPGSSLTDLESRSVGEMFWRGVERTEAGGQNSRHLAARNESLMRADRILRPDTTEPGGVWPTSGGDKDRAMLPMASHLFREMRDAPPAKRPDVYNRYVREPFLEPTPAELSSGTPRTLMDPTAERAFVGVSTSQIKEELPGNWMRGADEKLRSAVDGTGAEFQVPPSLGRGGWMDPASGARYDEGNLQTVLVGGREQILHAAARILQQNPKEHSIFVGFQNRDPAANPHAMARITLTDVSDDYARGLRDLFNSLNPDGWSMRWHRDGSAVDVFIGSTDRNAEAFKPYADNLVEILKNEGYNIRESVVAPAAIDFIDQPTAREIIAHANRPAGPSLSGENPSAVRGPDFGRGSAEAGREQPLAAAAVAGPGAAADELPPRLGLGNPSIPPARTTQLFGFGGAAAGVEPETDDEGRLIGVRVDPNRAALGILAAHSPQALQAVAKQAPKGVPASDWLRAMVYNGMISGARTIGVNLIGGGLEVPKKLVRDLAAAPVNREALAYEALGAARGAWMGVQEGVKALQGQATSRRVASGMPAQPLPGLAGAIVEAPGRVSSAVDEFWWGILYGMEQHRLAAKEARGVFNAADTFNWVSSNFKNVQAPTSEEAARFANRATLKADMTGTTGGQLLEGIANELEQRSPWLKDLMMPFWRTSYQIATRGLEMTPLGLLGTANDLARVARGKARPDFNPNEQVANNLMGLGLGFMAYSAAASGSLTGAGPTEPDAREAWIRKGNQPYSLKVGDRWYSYSQLGPFAYPIATAADWVESGQYLKDDPNGTKRVYDLAQRLGKFFSDQGPVNQLADFMELLGEPNERGVTNTVGRIAGRSIPFSAALRTAAESQDTVQREAGNPLEYVQSGIPHFRSMLPPGLDALGREKANPYQGLSAISPLRSPAVQADPADLELARHGINVSKPNAKIGDVPLTREQARDYGDRQGDSIRAAVEQVMARPDYGRASFEKQTRMLDTVISDARDKSRDEIVPQEKQKNQPSDWVPKYNGVSNWESERRIDAAIENVNRYISESNKRANVEKPAAEDMALYKKYYENYTREWYVRQYERRYESLPHFRSP